MDETEELCHQVAIMDHGKILKLEEPGKLVDNLNASGFISRRIEKAANLEVVFITLTGRNLWD